MTAPSPAPRRRIAIAAGLLAVALAFLLLLTRPWSAEEPEGAPLPVAAPRHEPPATGAATVVVVKEEPRPAEAPPAPKAAPAAVQVHEGLGTFGRIVDGDRRPAGDVPVVLLLDGKVLTQARTGPDGEFLLPEMRVKAADRSHFEFALLATDGKGRAARFTNRMSVFFEPDEERELTLSRTGMGTMVLREAATLAVRVRAGGAAVEGATVWAEEEVPCYPGTEPVATGPDGAARIDSVPAGRWAVFAKCPGRGAGRARVTMPCAEAVEVALSPRFLDVEAVDSITGKPVEGVRFLVAQRRIQDGKEDWEEFFPPLDPPPTDSAGRTRIPDLGEVALRLRPIPPGCAEPLGGVATEPFDVDPLAATVRVPVRGLRTMRWKVLSGERTPPSEGAKLVVGEERHVQDPDLPWADMFGRGGRIENGDVVVEGLGWSAALLLARAPDGSVARLEADGGAERGAPVRFFAPRRLTVVVHDEDGKAVGDPVALLTPGGVAVAQPRTPEKEGRTVFDGLYAGEVVVCPLARIEWGGAEVARVDLAEGDRTVEAVVGRAFTLVARFRADGRPRIPAEYSMLFLTPGPDVRGEPHNEFPDEVGEDAAKGEVRIRVRPHAPGKPVVLQVTVPGRDPLRREALPPAAGGEAVVEFDL